MVTDLFDKPAGHSAEDNAAFIARLRAITGDAHVLTSEDETRRFRKGFRFGSGPALAVVRPGSLVEQWRVLRECVATGRIVIMQSANTGLTGGSTPDGDDYDREVVIINTMRIEGLHLINDGSQVVCLPGTTLYQLEKALKPLGREPHSVIGSSCIGASVFGGICNNSGGSLIRRGPAYTQMALFARVDENGDVTLVNHLGITLGDDPETILARLDRGDFVPQDIINNPELHASDPDYKHHVRDIEADTPARFNADARKLFEASGSAGKVVLFAVRLDTFPKEATSAVFYIGTNDAAELTAIRRHILGTFKSLPIAAEYMHRDIFDIAEDYGKDVFLAISWLGTDRLPGLFALKERVDAFADRLGFLPRFLSDRLTHSVSRLFPSHLPPRLKDYRQRYSHYLMLRVGGEGIAEARDYLSSIFPSSNGDYFECTAQEGEKAFLHRFAAAGAAIQYSRIHHKDVEGIVALDIALPRNEHDWFETLPDDIEVEISHKLYYGHFFCYVFHQDYIVKKGHEPLGLEHRMWSLLDDRKAEYPAEHNVGHLYNAKPALVDHYRQLDPCNVFNPGIGHTSKCLHWFRNGVAHSSPLGSSQEDGKI